MTLASLAPFDAAWLSAVLVLATPLLFAAVGELVSERAGVLNVGLEGMMLSGAFFAYYLTWETGSVAVGILGGMAGGLLFGVIMALLAVEAGADQIVSGIGINLAAFGLTAYLFDQVFSDKPQIVVPRLGDLDIPLLSDLPVIGEPLFSQDALLFLAFALVPAVWLLLYRSRWGLAIRASGETPEAAETAGVSVRGVRWAAILTASALAGLGGTYLAVVEVGIFKQLMTDGRGFLALAAVIFGRWRPVGVLGACVVLGSADALQLRLASASTVPDSVWGAILAGAAAYAVLHAVRRRPGRRRTKTIVAAVCGVAALALIVTSPVILLPDQLWRSLPYLLALAVLAGGVARARMPSRLGLEYRRGG